MIDEPALDAVYRDAYPTFVEIGIPLHVTLLYPFVPPGALDAALPRLRAVLARQEPFTFSLTHLETFPPRVVWVAPEPKERFVALMAAIQAEFPECLHQNGLYDEVIPHMTITVLREHDELDAALAALRPRVEPLLPVTLRAEEATVLVEQPDETWVEVARLPLGAGA